MSEVDDTTLLRDAISKIETLQNALQEESRRRGELETELANAQLYAASLECRAQNTKHVIADVEDTLLKELMLYKREALPDFQAHLFSSAVRGALSRPALEEAAVVGQQRHFSKQLSHWKSKCERYHDALEEKQKELVAIVQRGADERRLLQQQHADKVEQMDKVIMSLRQQVAMLSTKKFAGRLGVVKEQVAALRDQLGRIRHCVVDFQATLLEGSGVARRRQSSAVGNERWRRQSAVASFTLTTRRPTTAKPSTGVSPATEPITPGSSATALADSVAEEDTSGRFTPTTALPGSAALSVSKSSHALSEMGGLFGRVTRAMESAEARHTRIAGRMAVFYRCIRKLHKLSIGVAAMDDSSAMSISSQAQRLPELDTIGEDDWQDITTTCIQAVDAVCVSHTTLKSEALKMKAQLGTLNDALDEQSKDMAELRCRIPPQKYFADAVTVTIENAETGVHFVDKLTQCDEQSITSAIKAQAELRAAEAVASLFKPPLGTASATPVASVKTVSTASGTAAPRKSSGLASHQPAARTSTTFGSLHGSEELEWSDVGEASLVAEKTYRRYVLRTCMIQWLSKFHKRKQSQLLAFLHQRVAPALKMTVPPSIRSTSATTTLPTARSPVVIPVVTRTDTPTAGVVPHPPDSGRVSLTHRFTGKHGQRAKGIAMTRRPTSAAAPRQSTPDTSAVLIDAPDLAWLQVCRESAEKVLEPPANEVTEVL